MIHTWIFLQNPFFNCTKKNYKKAVKISTYTDAQLLAKIADPFYAALYAAYHPLHLTLVSNYNIWKAQGGTQKGSTVTLTDLLAQLSPGKSGLWDRAVQFLYPIGSSIYVAIFPKKMKPFYTGTNIDRINAVAQLEIALTGRAPLATTLADVTAFSLSLSNAETAQSGNIGGTATASTNVETARVAAMVMLYSILGQCIGHLAATPRLITVLFNLSVIRNKMQTIFTGGLKKSVFETITQRTFELDGTIDANSDGVTELGFYLAENAGDGPNGYTVQNVLSTKMDTLKVADFTGNTTNNFLCVVNLSDTLAGHYNVNIA
jgi:hypothetical protein